MRELKQLACCARSLVDCSQVCENRRDTTSEFFSRFWEAEKPVMFDLLNLAQSLEIRGRRGVSLSRNQPSDGSHGGMELFPEWFTKSATHFQLLAWRRSLRVFSGQILPVKPFRRA